MKQQRSVRFKERGGARNTPTSVGQIVNRGRF